MTERDRQIDNHTTIMKIRQTNDKNSQIERMSVKVQFIATAIQNLGKIVNVLKISQKFSIIIFFQINIVNFFELLRS